MLFKYKKLDSNGKTIKEFIEASTISEAKHKLKEKSILYISIESSKSKNIFTLNFNRKTKINNLHLSYISRDLNIYLKSGVSLVQSVKLLVKAYSSNKKLHAFFEQLSVYLDEGKTFYSALEKQNIFLIPTFYKHSIKVSENGGLLIGVLNELAIFLKEQERIKSQITQAMAYPLFILVISFFMLGFMLSVVVPEISSVFVQMGNKLPFITSFVIKLGDFFSHNYLTIASIIIFSISIFIYLYKQNSRFKYSIDSLLLMLPFFKSLIEFSELSRFAYMNSILMKSGVPFVKAIKLSSDILKNSLIKNVFLSASKKVVEGEKLSSFLNKNSFYKVDSSFIHAVTIGEETSELSEILSNLASLYNEKNKDKIAISLSLLEPALMLIVGSIIGLIVFSMLLPIFTMNLG